MSGQAFSACTVPLCVATRPVVPAHSGAGHQADITARNFEWMDEMSIWAVEHAAELAALDAQFRDRMAA